MGIELQTDPPPRPAASPSKPPPSSKTTTTTTTTTGREQTVWAVVDCVALIGMFALMGLRVLTPAEGLPWLAVILAARLKPSKGSGVATLAAGLISWDMIRK